MSVISVKQLWENRRASDNITKRTRLTKCFEVITDDPNDDEAIAGEADGLPRLGDYHPNYPDAFCVDVNPVQFSGSPFIWHVLIEYDSQLPSSAAGGSGVGGSTVGGAHGPGAESQGYDDQGKSKSEPEPFIRPRSPLDRRPVWTNDTIEEEKPFVEDVTGKVVLNSAGYPPDPPLMTDRRRQIIGLNVNVQSMDLSTPTFWIDGINSAPWKGNATGTVRIITFRTQSQFDLIDYLECFLQFKVKKEGWRRKTPDRGYYEIIEEFGTFQRKRASDPITGVPDPEPRLLDGNGRFLAPGEDPVIFPDEGYQEFYDVDFNALMTLLGNP